MRHDPAAKTVYLNKISDENLDPLRKSLNTAQNPFARDDQSLIIFRKVSKAL